MSMESLIDNQNLPGIILSQIIKPYNVLVTCYQNTKNSTDSACQGKGKEGSRMREKRRVISLIIKHIHLFP